MHPGKASARTMDENERWHTLRRAVSEGRIQWNHHALVRSIERGIPRAEVLETVTQGKVIEEYLEDRPFASCLILQIKDQPLHVVAALDPDSQIAHVITVYRPDLLHFEPDWQTRRR